MEVELLSKKAMTIFPQHTKLLTEIRFRGVGKSNNNNNNNHAVTIHSINRIYML